MEIQRQGTSVWPGQALAPVRLNEYVNIDLGRMMSERSTGLTFMDVTVTKTSWFTAVDRRKDQFTRRYFDERRWSDQRWQKLTDGTDDGSLDPGESVKVRLYFENAFTG